MRMNIDDTEAPFVEVVGYHTNYNLLVEGDAKRFIMDTDAAQSSDSMTTRRVNNSYSGTLCYSWDNETGANPQPWSAGDCAAVYGIASGEGTEDELWEYTTWECLDAFTCAGTAPATENADTWEALDTSADGYRWGQIDIADDGMYADCYDWDSLVADAAFSRLYESQTLDAFTGSFSVTEFPVAYLCYEDRVLSCNTMEVDPDATVVTYSYYNEVGNAWACIEGGDPAVCPDCWSVIPGVIAE